VVLWHKINVLAPDSSLMNSFRSSFKKLWQGRKTWLEVAALMVVIVYTIYSAKQVAETRAANRIAEQSLQQAREDFWDEQRPYVWLTSATPPPDFIRNKKDPSVGQIVWSYHFTNYGKAPALGIHFQQFMRLGDGPFKPSYGESGESIGSPLPPGKDDFDTIASDPGITPAQVSRLLDTSGISIKVVFKYTDATARKYETGFCLNRLNLGAVGYCRDGNYIK
jgi:hypothetical protein